MNIYSCQIFVFSHFSGYNFFCPYIIANKIHFSTVKAASFTPQNLAIFFQKRIYIPRNLVLWKTLCLTRFFPCALAVFFRLPALPFRTLKNYCQQMHISVSIVLKNFSGSTPSAPGFRQEQSKSRPAKAGLPTSLSIMLLKSGSAPLPPCGALRRPDGSGIHGLRGHP